MNAAQATTGRPERLGFQAAALLLPLCCIAVVALNRQHGEVFFLSAAPIGPLRHVAQMLLAPVFLLIAHGSGRLVLNHFLSGATEAYPAGSALLTGFAVFTVVAFLAGALGFYNYPTFFALFAGLACLTGRQQARTLQTMTARAQAAWQRLSWPGRLGRTVLYGAVAGTAGLVLLVKGVYPDYGGDIFYYFLYYQKILASGHLFPASFDYFIYYPAKASGLHYFLAVLCGLKTLTYASCVYFVFLCVTLAAFLSRITTRPLYFCLAILVAATNVESIIFTNNFSKTNFLGALLVYYLGYLSYELILSMQRPASRRAILRVMCICCFHLAFFTSQALLFSVAALGTLFAFESLRRRKFLLDLLAPMGVLLLTYAVLFLYNTLAKGYGDIATIQPFLTEGFKPNDYLPAFKQFDLLKPDQAAWPHSVWSSYLNHVVELLTSTGFLGSRFAPGWWAALAAAGLCALRKARRNRVALTWMGTVAALFLFYVFSCSLIGQDYYRKHSMFLYGIFFKITLYVGSFALLEHFTLHALLQKTQPQRLTARVLVAAYAGLLLAFLGGTALWGMPLTLSDDLRERMEYLTGKTASNATFINYYGYLAVCSQAMQAVSGSFLALADMPACLGYSNGRMLDMYAARLQPILPALLGDDVAEARSRLAQSNIDAFAVDLKQEPTLLAFAPVFSPQSLEQSFTVAAQLGQDAVLLRSRRPGDPPLPAAFGDAYRAYLQKYDGHSSHADSRDFTVWLQNGGARRQERSQPVRPTAGP